MENTVILSGELLEEYRKTFIKDLNELGLDLNEDKWNMFSIYYNTLIEWNEFMNLTAITDIEGVFKKHFVDSLSIMKTDISARLKNSNPVSIIDVGTGAGFPGIPLKIMFPEIKLVLMDSLGKRIKFLNEVIKRCDLSGVTAVHSRAEDLGREPEYRDHFDISVSRAVAALGPLCEYCLPFVKKGGCFIAYKADKAESELEGSENSLKALSSILKEKRSFKLPNTDLSRNLLVFEKFGITSKLYPRKAGMPTRQPLW